MKLYEVNPRQEGFASDHPGPKLQVRRLRFRERERERESERDRREREREGDIYEIHSRITC